MLGKDEEFVSEAIEPKPGTFDIAAMSRAEPGLPTEFTWRGQPYAIARVLSVWKTSTVEPGGHERYLRRHWYTIQTATGETMTLYCERQAKHPGRPKARWWLYTIVRPSQNQPSHPPLSR